MEELGPAITDLVVPLDQTQLKNVAIEAILEHRRLLAIAEKAYSGLKTTTESQDGEEAATREAYVRAMLNSKSQMAVIAVLVDRLGYVPDVPKKPT